MKAFTSCRSLSTFSAFSSSPEGKGANVDDYIGFNLAMHVGDDPAIVLANRQKLKQEASLPNEPFWLNQVHGITSIEIKEDEEGKTSEDNFDSPKKATPEILGVISNETSNIIPDRIPLNADASFTFQPNQVCVVLTGDCLPILLCDKAGTRVSAVHAGWRGLAAGVVEEAIQKLGCPTDQLLAWLGPAIGPKAFEVKEDVLAAFENHHNASCFIPTLTGTWLANIYQLARYRLEHLGVRDIFGGEFCTYSDTEQFYSARRSNKIGRQTGRMATLIWLSAF